MATALALASLLPMPRAVFYDQAGDPLNAGLVYTYTPGGTVPKTTYQDAGETTPNSNPIVLSSDGSCLLYGSGNYQITVTDALGNAVPAYSGLTSDSLAGTSGAVAPTVANIAALRATTATTLPQGQTYVLGYYTSADGGEGNFVYVSSDATSADNGGTIIVDASGRRWYRQTESAPVSIKAFGAKIDGTTNDSAAIGSAIAAASSQKFAIWCPAGVSIQGTTTLSFPNTMPEGFTFLCHPDFTISYSGTGSAVTIDSCYHVKLEFGRIVGTVGGSTTGLHFAPTNTGANGQNVCVVSAVSFVAIYGFQTGVWFDNSVGSVAQVNLNGIEISNGQGLPANSLTGNVAGIKVDGATPFIFQGNVIQINYIQAGPAAFAAGAVWIGITDGSTTFGPSPNNVNQYTYGAIDGAGYATSFGLNIFAGNNSFTGPIVDVQFGVQFEIGATNISIVSADINVNAGGTRIHDLTDGADGTYVWLGGQGFTRTIQAPAPGNVAFTQLPNHMLLQTGVVELSASPTTFSFPAVYSATPFIVGSQSNNTTPGTGVDVIALSESQYVVRGPIGITITWMAFGQAVIT